MDSAHTSFDENTKGRVQQGCGGGARIVCSTNRNRPDHSRIPNTSHVKMSSRLLSTHQKYVDMYRFQPLLVSMVVRSQVHPLSRLEVQTQKLEATKRGLCLICWHAHFSPCKCNSISLWKRTSVQTFPGENRAQRLRNHYSF